MPGPNAIDDGSGGILMCTANDIDPEVNDPGSGLGQGHPTLSLVFTTAPCVANAASGMGKGLDDVRGTVWLAAAKEEK